MQYVTFPQSAPRRASRVMRIAIFGYDFPPVNRIGAFRPYAFAKYWSRMGHDVVVLTVRPEGRRVPVAAPSDFADMDQFKVVGLMGWHQRKARGAAIEGCAGGAGARESRIRRVLRKCFTGVYHRIVKHLGLGFLRDPGWLTVVTAFRAIEREQRNKRFDAFVTSFPPPSAILLGRLVQWRWGVTWVADYRDLWSDGHHYRAWWPLSLFQRGIERALLRHADGVLVINHVHQAIIGEMTSVIPAIVPNGFDHEDYSEGGERLVFPGENDRIKLIYTGTVFGTKRFPHVLFDALESMRLRDEALVAKLSVLFFSPDARDLDREIERRGLGGTVEVRGYVSRGEVLRWQRSAHALLFCDWVAMEDPGVSSGKVFEYLGSGRPVICIGGLPGSVASQIITDTGIGVVCGNDVDRLTEVLTTLIHCGTLGIRPDSGEKAKYRRDRLAVKAISAVCAAIKRRGRPVPE